MTEDELKGNVTLKKIKSHGQPVRGQQPLENHMGRDPINNHNKT